MSGALDAALRVGRHALDETARALAERQEELACLDARLAVLAAIAATERRAAAADASLPGTRYFARNLEQRAMLAVERDAAERAAERIREVARERLAEVRALEQAIVRRAAEEKKRVERRIQAEADDRAAARLTGALR